MSFSLYNFTENARGLAERHTPPRTAVFCTGLFTIKFSYHNKGPGGGTNMAYSSNGRSSSASIGMVDKLGALRSQVRHAQKKTEIVCPLQFCKIVMIYAVFFYHYTVAQNKVKVMPILWHV